jgi:hypothetical protein
MRTPLLAGLVAVLLPACIAGEITDVGGEDGTGDGSGDGSGDNGGGDNGGGDTNNPTPRVTATVDKTTIDTELGKTEMITVSLQSMNGFAGNVAVAARMVDATNAVMPQVTMQAPSNVTLAADATGTAALQLTVPMNATGADLAGSLKIDLTSSAGTQTLTSAINIKAIYTVDYLANTGTAVANHTNTGNTPNLRVKRGAILRFHNSDTARHIIHGGGAFPHENTTTGGASGRNYDVATIALQPGSSGTLGCHDHGTATYSTYTVE